jgi:hypothetical protein
MKITQDIPDRFYHQMESQAAFEGQSIESFLLDAIRAKVVAEQNDKATQTDWRAVFGKANLDDVADVQPSIDDEFNGVATAH